MPQDSPITSAHSMALYIQRWTVITTINGRRSHHSSKKHPALLASLHPVSRPLLSVRTVYSGHVLRMALGRQKELVRNWGLGRGGSGTGTSWVELLRHPTGWGKEEAHRDLSFKMRELLTQATCR